MTKTVWAAPKPNPPIERSSPKNASNAQSDSTSSLPKEAAEDFESAMFLWEDQDYRGAQLKFQLVYAKTGDPRLLWNLAVCEKALRHYAKALPLVKRYLTDAEALITKEQKDEALELARAIENFVSPVQIETAEAGAIISVDGEEMGKTPLKEPLILDMGDRKITLRKRGFKEATTLIRVLGQKQKEHVVLNLERDIPAATLEVRAGKGQWITVDDNEVGKDRWEGLVSPGFHHVRVTGTGYKTQTVEVDLSNGGRTSVWVTPRPLDPAEKGYLWPLVGALATVTAVVGVVAYYGLKPTNTRANVVETGQLDNLGVGFVHRGF
jgi:hypothetical protein